VGSIPLLLATSPAYPAQDMPAFLNLVRNKPGSVSYASVGAGSSGHLAAEQLKLLAKVDMLHVPFSGPPAAVTAMLGRQVNFMMLGAGNAETFARDPRIRVLATVGDQRLEMLPGCGVDLVWLSSHQAAHRSGLAGSTLAAVEVNTDTIRPYHIGDTEILVVGQRGKLKFQSISHSLVGMGVEAGLIAKEDALHHDHRHIILNAIGSAEMRIELGAPLALDRFDTLLLASDGLTDNLKIDEIIEIIRNGPLDQAVIKLAALAQKRMSEPDSGHPSKPDDLTLLAYRRSH
jgi:hypothetical protein